MLTYSISLHACVRRRRDVDQLAAEVEADFRAATVGDLDLDLIRTTAYSRGGVIVLRARVEDETDAAAFARVQEIGRSIESDRSRVDRIDEYRAVALREPSGIVGFTQGDFRGWQREVALEELDADRGVA